MSMYYNLLFLVTSLKGLAKEEDLAFSPKSRGRTDERNPQGLLFFNQNLKLWVVSNLSWQLLLNYNSQLVSET